LSNIFSKNFQKLTNSLFAVTPEAGAVLGRPALGIIALDLPTREKVLRLELMEEI